MMLTRLLVQAWGCRNAASAPDCGLRARPRRHVTRSSALCRLAHACGAVHGAPAAGARGGRSKRGGGGASLQAGPVAAANELLVARASVLAGELAASGWLACLSSLKAARPGLPGASAGDPRRTGRVVRMLQWW